MTDQSAVATSIPLHYLDHPGGEPALLFLPGLTATAPMFEDLINAGLSPRYRSIALDLRGRGKSKAPPAGSPDTPAANYTMADHAADVLTLLDNLGVSQAALVGHSFGGMLALYLAARHPNRFPQIVVVDAAVSLATPETRKVLEPALSRLGVVVPSWDAYLGAVKQLPYFQGVWEPSLERYFREYVDIHADGSVTQRVSREAIQAAIEGLLAEDWLAILRDVVQPVLLINAVDPFGPAGTSPFLTRDGALDTIAKLANGHYLAVSGNHITMIFGSHAHRVAEAICDFLANEPEPRNPGLDAQDESTGE
ncbi:MAG: alpha/beta hydrolase [Planctomycetaceae bacterium]|nr:alpha/beta hydrolase [Planctomycetaceae bacterium]